MALTLTFNQEFLPPGGNDQGRTDIYSDVGAAGRANAVQISVGGIPDASTIELVLLDEAPGSSPLLTQLSPELWTLDFLLGCWGPFRLRCNAVVGGVVVDSVTRRISVRSPGYALQYPALSERTDPNAQLVATVPSIDITEMNEGATNRPLVDFHREVVETLESIGAGSISTIPDGAISEAKLDPAFVEDLVFRDGSHSMLGALDMSGHKVIDLAQPTAPTDAARLADVTAAAVIAGDGLTQSGPTVNVVGNADGSIVVGPNDVQVGTLATDAQHGARGGGTQHQAATTVSAGFQSSLDKVKLDGITPGADPTIATLAAAAAPISVNGQRITSVGAPTANSDATNKTYVDNRPPVAHGSTHANGGTDELDVTGLAGVLADPQVAGSLKTATGAVVVSAAAAPSVGQVPTATGASAATWQTPTQLASAAPTQITVTTAAQGVATTAARADHVHSVLANVTPSSLPAGGTAAIGTSTALARADHVHDIPAGTPSALAVGGSNAGGSSSSVARADHVHALVGYGNTGGTITQGNDARLSDDRTASGIRTATSIVVASAAAAPSVGQVPTATGPTALTWQTPLQLASAAPSTVSDVAAAVGVATAAARTDHVHAVSTGAPAALPIGSAQATGTATSLAKSDHVHSTPSSGTPSSLTLAGANAAGVATTIARSDHTHALPATATPSALTVGGAANAGASTSLVRADHVHAMPGLATGAADGFQAAADFTKLAGIEAGAQVVTFARVQTALAVASSAVGFNAQRLSGVADPSNPQDVATKAYTDAIAQGLDTKASVRLVATSNVAALTGAVVIDGVTTAADRVLLTAQSTPSANGLYLTSAGGAWARTTDADTSAKVTSGLYVFATEGAANSDSGWALITPDPIVLGTTALTFTQVSGAGQITAGAGMTKSGNTLNVVAHADASIVVAADTVQVGVLATDAQHGTRGGGTLHAAAVAGGASGFFTGADKTRLDGMATGAAAVGSTTPIAADVTAAAVGAATTAARSDHRHQVTVGSPVALPIGASPLDGTSTALARADHRHQMPSAGTPVALTLAGTNSVGVNTTLALSDHVHALPASSTAPPALTVGGSSAAGSSTSISKADHVHALAAPTVVLENTGLDSLGVSTAAAREDHQHLSAWKTICVAVHESVGFDASSPPSTVSGITIVAGDYILVDGRGAPLVGDDPAPLTGEIFGIFLSLGATWLFIETLDRGEVAYVKSTDSLWTYDGSQYVELYAHLSDSTPTQVYVRAAHPGVTSGAARADHVHNVATNIPLTLSATGTNTEGTSQSLARADHLHNIATAAPTALTVGGAQAAGSSTSLARADHVHAMPGLATSSVSGFMASLDKLQFDGIKAGTPWAIAPSPAAPTAGTVSVLSSTASVSFPTAPADGDKITVLCVPGSTFNYTLTATPKAIRDPAGRTAALSATFSSFDGCITWMYSVVSSVWEVFSYYPTYAGALATDPRTNGFRLAANASDTFAADGSYSSIWLAPVNGDRIALYDIPTTTWRLFSTAALQYSLSGRSAGIPFDVFAYQTGGTVALEVQNWSSATVRATSIARRNGVWVMNADNTRRYIGTVRARSSTTYRIARNQVADSGSAGIDYWNVDNKLQTSVMLNGFGTPSSYAYTGTSYRQANASSNAQIDTVSGQAGDPVYVQAMSSCNTSSATSVSPSVAIGFNNATPIGMHSSVQICRPAAEAKPDTALLVAQLSLVINNVGTNSFTWLEAGGAGVTFFGTTLAALHQPGMTALVWY